VLVLERGGSGGLSFPAWIVKMGATSLGGVRVFSGGRVGFTGEQSRTIGF
jgi:hypothetical protein